MKMAKKSIDRRVARTRGMLHDALISLISAKGYDLITVEEICERANVGRSTFYSHYTSKDDLMRSGLKSLRHLLLNRQANAFASRNPKGRGLAFSLTMFEHARNHMHLHRTLLGNRGGAIALETVRQILADLVRSEIATAAGKNRNDSIPREIVVHYLVGAYMAVVSWWLEGGAKLAPERIDAMFQSLTAEGIACFRS